MDSWIMGLLYQLIVPGPRPFGGGRIILIGVSHRWNVWQEFCRGKTRGMSGASGKMGILAPAATFPKSPTEPVERKGPGP